MKKMTTAKIWQFAIGQFGWALLSGIISNWLVYFYQPDPASIEQGQAILIPQGRVVFGLITVIGAITAFGRIFDAITDPLIAAGSDRCTSKQGRRIPFLKWSALPLAISVVLVFWSPAAAPGWLNSIFLFVTVMLYYLSITAYCTPYTALIPELGHTEKERLQISTAISFTFIAGTAVAYLAPVIWGMFVPGFGRMNAIRLCFTLMAVLAFICMEVPVLTIREKDYVDTVPTEDSAFSSLTATFRNGEFRRFVASDIFYWIGITIFQTGLPFFVTGLLGLPESMTTLYFVAMTACSLIFYLPVGWLAARFGKKKTMLAAFVLFALTYAYAVGLGRWPGLSAEIQGWVLTVAAAFPMATFGILPQMVVADIAKSESKMTGANREGMFYAARTFAFKMGQSVSMLIFTAVSTIGVGSGLGYRIAAVLAAVFCAMGGLIFIRYREQDILKILDENATV